MGADPNPKEWKTEDIRSLEFEGVDPHQNDARGMTPIASWSWEGVPGAVKRLLELGADPNDVGNQQFLRASLKKSPLIRAIEGSRNLETVKVLLDAGADPNDLRSGLSPVMQLVISSPDTQPSFCPEILDLLIKRGADVNLRSPVNGMTALMWAASSNNLPYADLLVRAGARLDEKDGFGRTALDHTTDSSIGRHRLSRCANFLRQEMRKQGVVSSAVER